MSCLPMPARPAKKTKRATSGARSGAPSEAGPSARSTARSGPGAGASSTRAGRTRSGPGTVAGGPASSPLTAWVLAAVLLVAVLAIYWQTTSFEFVNLDDGLYLVDNPRVNTGLSGENVRWAFTTGHAANWHPVTWLSHQGDVALFGMNAGAHHAVSVVWHALNALLLFALMRALTGSTWKSFFVAAFFAVHPTRVESVAWVAERKDVLSTFFWLSSTWAWMKWVRQPALKWFLAALVLFAFGLMAKPMLVTVPFTWLLLEHWPLARPAPLRQRVIEKWPFFSLAIASSLITFIVQREGGAVGSAALLPIGDRITHALVSYVRYLGQLVWPVDLAPFYPHPMETAIAAAAGAALLLGAITWLAWRTRHTHGYLFTGWLWFVGTLIPVIGLVQVGTQSHADRYTYVPFIGLFIALAWTTQWISRRWNIPCRIFDAAGAALGIAVAVLAWQQAAHWRTSEALWTHTVAVTDRNARAHNLLGAIYANSGRIELAEAEFKAAMASGPDLAEGLHIVPNLGRVLMARGKPAEALPYLERARTMKPGDARILHELGTAYMSLSRNAEAIGAWQEAVRVEPNSTNTWFLLGMTLAAEGQVAGARHAFSEVLRIDPSRQDAAQALAKLR
jgi:Flp pilus assembly protein TadD